jgi:ferritin-like protein
MKTKVIPVQIDEITTTGIDGTTYEIKQAMLKNYVAQKIRLMPQPAKKKKNKLKRG